MEILKRKLIEMPTNSQNTFENSEDNIYFRFLDAIFNILSKCDSEILDLCETVIFKIYFKK